MEKENENEEGNIGFESALLLTLVAAGLISSEVANNKEWTIVPVSAKNGKKTVEVISGKDKEDIIEIPDGTLQNHADFPQTTSSLCTMKKTKTQYG